MALSPLQPGFNPGSGNWEPTSSFCMPQQRKKKGCTFETSSILRIQSMPPCRYKTLASQISVPLHLWNETQKPNGAAFQSSPCHKIAYNILLSTNGLYSPEEQRMLESAECGPAVFTEGHWDAGHDGAARWILSPSRKHCFGQGCSSSRD